MLGKLYPESQLYRIDHYLVRPCGGIPASWLLGRLAAWFRLLLLPGSSRRRPPTAARLRPHLHSTSAPAPPQGKEMAQNLFVMR